MATSSSTACFNCHPYCNVVSFNVSRSVPKSYPVIRDVSLALFIIGIVHVLVSFTLFSLFISKHPRLSKRSLSLTLCVSIGVICQCIGGVLDQALTIPCYLRVSTALAVVPVLGSVLVVKLLDFLNRNVYSRAVVKHLNNAEHRPSKQSNLSFKLDVYIIDNYFGADRGIFILKFLISTKARIGAVLFLFIPFFIASAVEWSFHPELSIEGGCRGCTFSKPQRYLIVAAGSILVALGLLFAAVVRKYPDPYYILTEIKIYAIGGILGLIGFQAGEVGFDGDVSPVFSLYWITWIGMMLIQFITCTWQVYKTVQEVGVSFWSGAKVIDGISKNEEISVATRDARDGSIAKLKQFLEKGLSDLELQAFEKYLTSEFSVENLRMYLECQQWETAYFDMTDQSKRSRAKKIIGYFVERDSLFNVNLPGTVREDLVKTINDPISIIPVELFDNAKKELFYMLLGSYIRFSRKDL